MALAGGEPARNQILRALEKDEADVCAPVHENVAIGALQRRTGDHRMLALPADAVDLVGNRLQPGQAVFVGQRMARAHLRDIAWGMKPVAVLVAPAQPFASASATVLLPEPETPITINAQGVVASPTKILRQRGLVDQPDRLADRASALRRQVLASEHARQDRALFGACDLEQHLAAGGSACKVSVTRGTKGSTLALGTPTTQRSRSRAPDSRERSRRCGRPVPFPSARHRTAGGQGPDSSAP